MTVLVVTNAATARARRHYPALRDVLPESAALRHRITESPEEMDRLVGHDRWRPDDLLVINGGDGSVQHALSLLLAHCPSQSLPRVACLPGGSTNMTAYDVNRHRPFHRCVISLRQAVGRFDESACAPRPVVRVEAGDRPMRCGLFFGLGTIVQGIDYFKTHVRHRGGAQEMGAGVALARALWGIARNQPPFSEALQAQLRAAELYPPDGAGGEASVTVRLLFATTLERLFLGMRPYWGSGTGALKATLVERHAEHLMRRMPRLLRGRPDRYMTPAAGYHSARLDHLQMAFSGAYTLDGELFPTSNARIAVSATDPVRFVPL